ncbi:hypothetical protein [Nocardia sp. NPDC050435]|uniref:hypothetical protein n=1 Tax=Nocardia sp. NPDC050435 TaxID=3155040 RepID=UPI0033FC7405
MLQTTVIVGHAFGGSEIHVPGFVRIDEMRQIDEYGRAEFYVVYDDADLDTVYQVGISNRSDGPPQQLQEPLYPLGKARSLGGSWSYTYYWVTPAPTWQIEKTIVFTGRPWNMTFYVPGFLGIDGVRQVEKNSDQIDVVVRYNAASNEVHKLHVEVSGSNRELPPGTIDLGLIYPYGLWRYIRATHEILPAAA